MTRTQRGNPNNESINPPFFDLENLITENKKIPLSISGLDSKKQKAKLESQIQEMVRTELVKYRKSKSKSTLSKVNPPDITDITISFESLPVPFEIRQSLESRVLETITGIVPKEEGVGKRVICVYTPIYPGGKMVRNFYPQYNRWFRWIPSSEDYYDVWISPPGLYPPNQMRVSLRIRAGMWAKEISAWHYHSNKQRGETVTIEGFMTLQKADCNFGAHTIVFRKPKFLAGWWDMYYFDTVEFWSLFGGRDVGFRWMKD